MTFDYFVPFCLIKKVPKKSRLITITGKCKKAWPSPHPKPQGQSMRLRGLAQGLLHLTSLNDYLLAKLLTFAGVIVIGRS